jgi:hypothetical protein
VAKKDIKVRLTGEDKASPAIKKVKGGLGDLDKTVKKSSVSMLKAGAAIGAAVVAFRTLNKVMNDLQEAYFVQEQAEASFQAALRATGTEAEVSAQSIFDFASKLQEMTIYGDEAIISATSLLQSLAKLNEDGLKKLIPLMLDFSTGMKLDLNAAMSLVGKTLGSTTNALSRYGITIDMTLSKEEKLAQLTEELQNKFGGMAEAIGDTAYGSTVKLSNAIGDLKEQMGRSIAVGMKPFRQWLTNIFIEATKVKEAINDAAEYINKLGQQQVTAAESLEYWNTQMAQSETALSKLWSRMWRGKKIQSEEYIKAKIAEYEIQAKIEEAAARYDKKVAARLAKELADAEEKTAAIQLLFDIESEALERLEELRLQALPSLEKELKLIQDELDLYSDLKRGVEKYGEAWVAVEDVILMLLDKEKKVRAEIANIPLTGWDVGEWGAAFGLPSGIIMQGGGEADEGGNFQIEERERISSGLMVFNEALSAGAPQIAGFITMVGEFSTMLSTAAGPAFLLVVAVLAVIEIFKGMMEVLKPLIDNILQPLAAMLQIIGRVIGAILAPGFEILGRVVELVGQVFIWLYNKVILPVGNFFIKMMNMLYNTVILVGNGFIQLYNLLVRKSKEKALMAGRDITAGTLGEISLGDIYPAGETGRVGGTTADLGSTTTIQRQPDNYFHIYFQSPILGVSGIDEAAELIIAAIERHGVLGGKIQIAEAIVPMAGG